MTLLLFGEPRLAYGETGGSFTDREIPEGGKRLIAYAALHRGRLDRRHAAGTLRPACDEVRAAGNFRSALRRLRAAGVVVLEADKRRIRPLPGWPDERVGPHRERLRQRVLHAMEARSRALLAGGDPRRALAAARLLAAAEPQRASAHRLLAEVTRSADGARPSSRRRIDS